MKRSAASTKPQPEDVVLLLDENLSGRSILSSLREQGIPVAGQAELLPRGISDSELLTNMAKLPGHYLLTRDPDFRYKRDVVETLRRVRVSVFVLTASGNKTGAQLAELIAATWPAMKRFIAKNDRPFVAKVRTDGSIMLHR